MEVYLCFSYRINVKYLVSYLSKWLQWIKAYQHMYLTREGDTIPNIRKLNPYYGTSMLLVAASPECPISLYDMHSDAQHTSMLSYQLHTTVHIARDVTFMVWMKSFTICSSSLIRRRKHKLASKISPATGIASTYFSNCMACWLIRCITASTRWNQIDQIRTFSTWRMQFLLCSQAWIAVMRQFTVYNASTNE